MNVKDLQFSFRIQVKRTRICKFFQKQPLARYFQTKFFETHNGSLRESDLIKIKDENDFLAKDLSLISHDNSINNIELFYLTSDITNIDTINIVCYCRIDGIKSEKLEEHIVRAVTNSIYYLRRHFWIKTIYQNEIPIYMLETIHSLRKDKYDFSIKRFSLTLLLVIVVILILSFLNKSDYKEIITNLIASLIFSFIIDFRYVFYKQFKVVYNLKDRDLAPFEKVQEKTEEEYGV